MFLCIHLLSCTENEEEKKKHQLRKEVLEHYKGNNNPLKEKAALFLLNNLKNRYAIEGKRYQAYTDTIKKYYQNAETLHEKLISVKKRAYNDTVVKDITALNAGFLIENIDRAFDALDKAGWKDQIRFEDFCEFILPYRTGTEPLEHWRNNILQDSILKITNDSIFSFVDLRAAATYLSKKQSKLKESFLLRWGVNAANIPDLPFSTLNLLTTGTCSNLTQFSTFACRTAAIPITNDFTPNWANFAPGHEWASIITRSGPIPFNIPIKDSLGVYRNKDQIPTKVYRHIFSENMESHIKQRGYCEFLPDFFNNPRLLDVTNSYMQTFDIAIPVLRNSEKSKFAYLAASKRENWSPVGWGIVKNGLSVFSKIGSNSVYLPVFVTNSGTQPFNYPFVVAENGDIHYIKPDLKNLQDIKLIRKHPIGLEVTKYIDRMILGKFQVSHNRDFIEAKTVYTILESPGVYFNDIEVNEQGKYRYARYLGRDSSQCNVAEIEFYENHGRTPLVGEIIGTKGNQPLGNAFDGNVLTYIDAPVGINRWVGLDFGKAVKISKIRFVSRNDKNQIIRGNLYELFYWEDEWKSLGQKTATDKILVYEQVPSNCLFLLKNLTEGKDERIFTYEKSKQIWR